MRLKPSTYLIAGALLALATVLMVVGVMIQPDQAATPIAATKVFAWKLSLVAFYAAAAFMLTALFALAFHFAGTDQAGWALLAAAAVIPGTVGYLAGSATEWTFMATGVVPNEGGIPHPVWGVAAMAAAGRMLCWLGLAAAALAVSREAAFPRWFGLLGVLIGVLEIAGEVLLSPGPVLELLWLAGFAWLFVLGLLMVQARNRLAGAAPAA
ncbi:MAG: hypothetical protein FIB01_15675 [Gemmatimonadetes bacterium]|nr:hypothetical protein [Gemmatimonadota bacterium]